MCDLSDLPSAGGWFFGLKLQQPVTVEQDLAKFSFRLKITLGRSGLCVGQKIPSGARRGSELLYLPLEKGGF